MHFQRLIPSLLLADGRLVKGTRFSDYKDAGLPFTTARAHNAQGADEMLLLDIQASRLGRGPDLDAVRKVAAECFMPLTVGGGIASLHIAEDCMNSGADKLCVNGTALDDPSLIEALARRYGSQAVVLAVDAMAGRVFDHRESKATDIDALDWIARGVDLGAGEIRLMSVEREGRREGMDIALFERVRRRISVPIILEGGAGSLEDLDQALKADADGVGIGTMLVFSDNNIVKLKRFLHGRGCRIRL